MEPDGESVPVTDPLGDSDGELDEEEEPHPLELVVPV